MTRDRKQRRERERAARKAAIKLERAASVLPGGSPAHPIAVSSSSVVEVRARETPCVLCGGELDPRGDRATSTARGVLREIEAVCRACHAPRTLWFLIAPPAAN